MTWVLAVVALAASPRVEFVERDTVGVKPETSLRVRTSLVALSTKAGLRAVLSTEGCTSSDCLKQISESKGVSLVGVTVVKSRRGLTIDLEAVFGPRVLLQQTFASSSDSLETSADAQRFGKELAAKLVATVPAEDPVVTDAPRVETPKSVPLPTEPTPAWVEQTPTRSAGPGVVVGVSAGGMAVGGGLLVAGLGGRANLDAELKSQPVVTTLTRPQAQSRADVANVLMGAGSVTAALGAAGLVTGLMWLTQP